MNADRELWRAPGSRKITRTGLQKELFSDCGFNNAFQKATSRLDSELLILFFRLSGDAYDSEGSYSLVGPVEVFYSDFTGLSAH